MPFASLWRSRLHRKPRSLEPVLHELVGSLRQHAGESLRAIILYGSAASGEYHPAKSNLDILVVIAGRDAVFWGRLQSFAARWLCHGLGLPIFFTEPELRDWSQSFPIEFLDIQANHRVLHGEDVIAPLAIDHAHLRWQCESELRGKLLRLRQAFIAQPSRDELQRVLERSLTSLLPVFRALAQLQGLTPSPQRREVIAAVARAFRISDGVFHDLLQLKSGTAHWSTARLTDTFTRYLKALEQLAIAIDRLPPASTHV